MFENVTKAPTDVHRRRAESTEGASHGGGVGVFWLGGGPGVCPLENFDDVIFMCHHSYQ